MTDFHYSDLYFPSDWTSKDIFVRGERNEIYTSNQLVSIPGPCCGCQREMGVLASLVLLNYTFCAVTPWGDPGPYGWGCGVCQIPSIGTIAVLCDHCVKSQIDELYFFIFGPLESGWRVIAAEAQNYVTSLGHSLDFHRGILDIQSSQKNCFEKGRNQ